MLVIAEVAGRGRRRTEDFQGRTLTAERLTLVRGGRRTDGLTIGSQFPIGKVGFAKVV